MMRVMPISELPITPTMGSLVGSTVSSDILNLINTNNGGVIFGQPGDPLQDHYNHFTSAVVDKLCEAELVVKEVRKGMANPYKIRAIRSEEELRFCPVSMQLPILMMEPVKKLFIAGRLQGYGFDKDYLPEEDVFGRLCDNGKITLAKEAYENNEIPEYVTWEYKSSDPDLTMDELDDIDVTRAFIYRFMQEHPDVDPTDPSCKIGKSRIKAKM